MTAAATVAAADIARLAGVGRAAVSNWRRRHADFPAPTGGSAASPVYLLTEVEAWFARHGKRLEVRPEDRVWQVVRGAGDDLRLADLVGFVGLALLAEWRSPESTSTVLLASPGSRGGRADGAQQELPRRFVAAVPELPAALAGPVAESWLPVLATAVKVGRNNGIPELWGQLCNRYLEARSRQYQTVTRSVADLMVELALLGGGRAAASVTDPACGTGSLLLAAQDRGARRLAGQDAHPAAVRLALVRLLLTGGVGNASDVLLTVGESLLPAATSTGRDCLADAVVCVAPSQQRGWGHDSPTADLRWVYGPPPRSEPELAWLQHCLAQLAEDGQAVVAIPTAVASRRAGRRIRANLLRAGVLRAVVSLPANAVVGGGTAPDLWVLRRTVDGEPPPTWLLFAEVSDEPAGLADVVRAWRAFRADPGAAELVAPAARRVPVADLLDQDTDVSPRRKTAAAARRHGQSQGRVRPDSLSSIDDELRRAMAGLAEMLALLSSDISYWVGGELCEPMSTSTVATFVRDGVLSVHQAPLRTAEGRGDLAMLTANDVRLGRPASGWTTAVPGMVPVEPGDVVVAATPGARQPAVRVDDQGSAVLGPQLWLLRPDPGHLDPQFVAGFLRAAVLADAAGSDVGQGGSRFDPRRVTLPRLPVDGQRAYGRLFGRVWAVEAATQEIGALSEALVRIGHLGLADGSFRPADGSRGSGT